MPLIIRKWVILWVMIAAAAAVALGYLGRYSHVCEFYAPDTEKISMTLEGRVYAFERKKIATIEQMGGLYNAPNSIKKAVERQNESMQPFRVCDMTRWQYNYVVAGISFAFFVVIILIIHAFRTGKIKIE